jgi:hypothetical protein
MSGGGLAIDGWLDLAEAATKQVVDTCLAGAALAAKGRRFGRPPPHPNTDRLGVVLPVVTHTMTMYVCLFSTDAGCTTLARSLLGMGPDDEALPPEAVHDAIGEIVNILAGAMQGELGKVYPGIELALPCIIHGDVVNATENCGVADIDIGGVTAELIVFGQQRGSDRRPAPAAA